MRITSQSLFMSLLAVVLAACNSGGGSSRDTISPQVALTGGSTQILAFGEPYTELGATASDNKDGNLSTSIVIDASSVDTSTPGDYTVTYNVTDAAGNAATTVTRTVTVQPPVPEPAEVSVQGDPKQLLFSWDEVQYTDYYRLLENPDGHSGFTQLGEDISADTLTTTQDIAVHLFDWVNAQYQLEACNVTGCSISDVITAIDVMLDTIGHFKASNTESEDHFGGAVALSADGNTLAVVAPGEDSCATGVSRAQDDNACFGAGAVYLFRSGDNGWHQQAYIKASNTDAGDQFGSAIALSADGNTLAVGAPGEDSSATGIDGDQADNSMASAGAVYIFRYEDGGWRQSDYIKASNTGVEVIPESLYTVAVTAIEFGTELALSADGDSLSVAGQAGWYMIRFDGVAWHEQAYFTDYWCGGDLATDAVGGIVAIASSDTCGCKGYCGYGGSVVLYRFENDSWDTQHVRFEGGWESNLLPVSVALSAEGDLLAVGAENDYWDGPPMVILLRADGLNWNVHGDFYGRESEGFARKIALSGDGTKLVVGTWGEDSCAAGINGDQDDNACEDSGAVYLYRFDGSVWHRQTYIKASSVESGDVLWVVALSTDGDTMAVGASGEDSCATGIDGNQDDNSCGGAGAVYVY